MDKEMCRINGEQVFLFENGREGIEMLSAVDENIRDMGMCKKIPPDMWYRELLMFPFEMMEFYTWR